MALPKLFHVNDDSPGADLALLCIRVLAGATLFHFSGAPKLLNFLGQGDPLQLGAFAVPAMVYATFALGICTLLVLVGFATRYAALFTTISLTATFFLNGDGLWSNMLTPRPNNHNEATWLFLSVFLALVFTGPGRISLDRYLSTPSHSGAR